MKLIIIKEETTPKFIRFLALNKRKGQERREVKRKGKEELTFLDSDPSLLDKEFPQVELVNTSRKSRRQLLLATDTNSFFKIKMLKDHWDLLVLLVCYLSVCEWWSKTKFKPLFQLRLWTFRAIFVWPWNNNAKTIQKQQTNRNGAIWLVYRTRTNAGGFWLVKRTLGWKNFMPENFLETNPYFALTSYCNTIGQSNNAFSTLGFSLAGKQRVHVLIFKSIGW